jgi:hypothetical protein
MKDFAVLECGSVATKSFLYNNGEITEIPLKTIPFKKNMRDGNLAENDVEELINFVNGFKDKTRNIFVYGTSIFRALGGREIKNFHAEFKKQTGIDFNVVSPEQESEYTVAGMTLGNNYRGRLAAVIAGGGSTEVCVIDNRKVIERHCNPYGAVTVTQAFENLNDYKPKVTLEQVDAFCNAHTADITNKSDILVVGGGDTLYFYGCVAPELLKPNKFYKDSLQPYYMTAEEVIAVDKKVMSELDIKELAAKSKYNLIWWSGARGYHASVRAVMRKCGAKYLIPTKINMCLGIINKLRQAQPSKD